MNTDKINRSLLSVVLVVLVLTVLVLLKVLFAGVNGVEWGSVSDWFNTAGTIGTLLVAYAAYKKAPEWMAQKHYDTAHLIIEEAVYKDLRKLIPLSRDYKIHIIACSNSLIQCLNDKQEMPENMNELLVKIEGLMLDFYNLAFSIQISLKSLPRYNFTLTEYTNSIIDLLRSTCDTYNRNQFHFELAAHEVPALEYADPIAKTQTVNELINIRSEHIKLNKQLADFIKSVYEDNKPISDFIVSR
ncbi:TPA: hypothetical protein R5X33_001944 [Enterobacter cloacae]|nr:hypothetical protein [Enterobacter cloacae]